MKQFSPYLIRKGMDFAEYLALNANIIFKSEREIVLESPNKTIAIYISPRDYDKDKQSAMIDKGGEYKTISDFFKRYNATENYVLIVHARRNGLRYVSKDCFFIIVPDETIQKEHNKQSSINIGVTPKQQERWINENVEYHPIIGRIWDISGSDFRYKNLNRHQNWYVYFTDLEFAILKKFGFIRPQPFAMDLNGLEEGDHYIGLGEMNSRAYNSFGVHYRITNMFGQKEIEPIAALKDGKKLIVEWPKLYLNLSDSNVELLKCSIESGWFENFSNLRENDFFAENSLLNFKFDTLTTDNQDSIEDNDTDRERIGGRRKAAPLDWDFDGQQMSSYRKEQTALRRELLQGRSEAPCVICGEVYPEDMLWAAHIKKRTMCSQEEKGDIPNIAALMCKFGCDDLFEKGYIAVKDGLVHLIGDSYTNALEAKREPLKGKLCLNWNEHSKKYYDWHFAYFMNS